VAKLVQFGSVQEVVMLGSREGNRRSGIAHVMWQRLCLFTYGLKLAGLDVAYCCLLINMSLGWWFVHVCHWCSSEAVHGAECFDTQEWLQQCASIQVHISLFFPCSI